jgi:hypothetical protein
MANIERRYRERECRFCGKLFWPKSPAAKTCSAACQRADRTAQKRRVVAEAMRALANESNEPLIAEEELAHEQLLELGLVVNGEAVPLSHEAKVKLRARQPSDKRMDIKVGMLHPLDAFAAQDGELNSRWQPPPQT